MKIIKEKKPEIVKWEGGYEITKGIVEEFDTKMPIVANIGFTICKNNLSPQFFVTEIKGKDIFGYYIYNYYGR